MQAGRFDGMKSYTVRVYCGDKEPTEIFVVKGTAVSSSATGTYIYDRDEIVAVFTHDKLISLVETAHLQGG